MYLIADTVKRYKDHYNVQVAVLFTLPSTYIYIYIYLTLARHTNRHRIVITYHHLKDNY